MISFQNISKTYENGEEIIEAVKDVSFEIQKGEIFGVVGFSGAGKSTLLRCVNLLERPTKGKVIVNNQDITNLSKPELRQVRRKIGMIFQHFNLLQSRTVFGNVAFPLTLLKTPKDEIKEKVMELLEFVGLEDKVDQYPDQLSGGQKQRVGIARALATSPDILLCDEATSALDPETTTSILRLLKKVNREYNITILMITHEMNVIREICDRVAIMEKGQVIESGSIFNVFTNPQTDPAQNFVQSVMQHKIPESILKKISTNSNQQRIYRITFIGESAGAPFLSELSKNFNIHLNVLYGQITELQNIPFGNLIVEFQGEQSEILRAIQSINSQITVKEVLGHAS